MITEENIFVTFTLVASVKMETVGLSLLQVLLFAQTIIIYAADSMQLVERNKTICSPFGYTGPTSLPDLSISPDYNSIMFLIDNMLVAGPVRKAQSEQITKFLEENIEGSWLKQLMECTVKTPNGGCSKLLVVFTPLLLSGQNKDISKVLKDGMLEHDLVDLMVKVQISMDSWYGLAQLINTLPLDILCQSETLTSGLNSYAMELIRPFVYSTDQFEALGTSMRLIEVLIAGGGEKTFFVANREIMRVFSDPFDVFRQGWLPSNDQVPPGFHIPLHFLQPLIYNRPKSFFAGLSRLGMYAIFDLLCYVGVQRGIQNVESFEKCTRPAIDDGGVEVNEAQRIRSQDISRIKSLAAQGVFLEIVLSLSLGDLQDIQRVGGNFILSGFIPFIADDLLLQLQIEDPANLFMYRVQAQGQLYTPGMIPFKFILPEATAPEFLKRHAREITAALAANHAACEATGDRPRRVSYLACLDDLCLEHREFYQSSNES